MDPHNNRSLGRNYRRKRKFKQKCCHVDQNNSGQMKRNDYNLIYTQMCRVLYMDLGTAKLTYSPLEKKGLPLHHWALFMH